MSQRKITLKVLGVCPVFLDEQNSRAKIGLLDVQTPLHKTVLKINGEEKSSEFTGTARLSIHRTNGARRITRKTEPTFSFQNPNQTGEFLDFRWIVNVDDELHRTSFGVDFSKLKASLILTEGEFSSFNLLGDEHGFFLVKFALRKPPFTMIQTRHVAEAVAVQIVLESGETAKLTFNNGTEIPLNDEDEYLIEIDNLCNQADAAPEDFTLIYNMIQIPVTEQIKPVKVEPGNPGPPSGGPHLGGLCLPLVFTKTSFLDD